MDDQTKDFGTVAQRLSRNPLGIIALFIVLVYGVAGLVTAFGSSLSAGERLPLIYFLVAFPVLVLGVFAWLVSFHNLKLYAPSDFAREENFVQLMSASASLALASAKSGAAVAATDVGTIVQSVQVARPVSQGSAQNQILWVDDRPDNNSYERQAFEAVGLRVVLALSTREALEMVAAVGHFAAIISDMERREGPQEGYRLLEALRGGGDSTPFFIYAGEATPEYERETFARGGQGNTNDPRELFRMVTRVARR